MDQERFNLQRSLAMPDEHSVSGTIALHAKDVDPGDAAVWKL